MSFLASIIVLTNLAFQVGFDTVRTGAVWATYTLAPSNLVSSARVPIAFKADPRSGANLQSWYRHSGYDRGHLVPAADMNWSVDALRETYYFSNICPMTPRLNRGAWEQTERAVRQLASSNVVNILIVPVYTNSVGIVPSSFKKVAWGDFGVRYWELENR